MTATPPGVDELDPVELEKQFAGDDEQVDGLGLDEDPRVVPPATPAGHHQTHGVPVGADSTSVAGS